MLKQNDASASNHANANTPTTPWLVSRVTALHHPFLFDFSSTQSWIVGFHFNFAWTGLYKNVVLVNVTGNKCLFLRAVFVLD